MPPSPGRIHSLPVKVLYSIDANPQSYLTILNDRQDVYVHPPSSGDDPQGAVGSSYLKAVAGGICFASPECVPNPQSLDFSVYNLDPTLRHRSSRAFQQSSNRPHSPSPPHEEASWVGKGFLSWSMAEPNTGNTLVKGRLVREYEFSPSRFNEQGGLEGLMAGHSGSGGRDEPGWGLEVCLTLKMVNPAGKEEFSGRRVFEEMLLAGRRPDGSGAVSRSSPAQASAASIPTPNTATTRRPSPLPSAPPHPAARLNGTSTPSYTTPPASSSSLPPPATIRQQAPQVRQPTPQRPSQPLPPPQLPHRSSSALSRTSQSSLPPSSFPMASSSSQPGVPSRPSSSTGRQHVPPPPPNPPSSDTPPPLSSSGPSRSQREITPPPLPRPKSPPPTTPHRRALRNLLQTDGKMSPKLAKELVNNPTLLALFKAVPANTNGQAHASGSTTRNESPNGSGSRHHQDASKRSPNRDRADTPTPSSSKTVKPVEALSDGCFNCGTLETSMWRVKTYQDGTKKKVCDACGVYFNKNKRMRPKELWDHQPQVVQSTPLNNDGQTTPTREQKHDQSHAHSGAKRAKHDHEAPSVPNGVRSSPRLHRATSGSNQVGHPPSDTSRAGGATSRSQSGHAPLQQHSASSSSTNPIPESPRRRKTGKPAPPPSPRMATRASARLEQSVSGDSQSHKMESFMNNFSPLDPSGFGTSPAVPLDTSTQPNPFLTNSHNVGNGSGQVDPNPSGALIGANGNGQAELDLESLLSSLTSGSNQDGFNMNNINFDELLATLAADDGGGGMTLHTGNGNGNGETGTGTGTGMDGMGFGLDGDAAEEMMKFLAGLEADEGEAS